ncbi:hypothetical protein PSU4_01350 [Pseudonocardia sulfidoxydans NBRC 16205]|uniref:Uncharacterized protein n=1 Tax=Pseudonocardia sulfidoxydans NBRC 16205 TaxID=1223511 RepID=A0A511D8R5_9PSEU|nr:hypothetical protein [Pseudonocardia sulfidoxydans]GEL21181.1 hypothetical protein PSU4_01350 [Pseudonocardia sulfidoxydans NBRC 16205]
MNSHDMAHEPALRAVELRRAAQEYRRGRRRAPRSIRTLLREVLAPPGAGVPARDGS